MTVAHGSLLIGLLLITMLLTGTLLARLPVSAAMVYLGLGYLLGPGGMGIVEADPFSQANALALMSEVAVLISIFAIGLKLNAPLRDRRWIAAFRLAFPVMAMTVGLIACVGVLGLGLPLGAAVLLGGILAPTDPVLATGIQAESGTSPDRVRFSLAGEGALNDGSAFPFVLLGLGLLGLHPLGSLGWHWLVVDLLWSTVGGLLIGAVLGTLIGTLVVYMRTRYRNALGLNEFLTLGLIAVSYGVAQSCLASGFLAVFAAGLAISRVKDLPITSKLAHELLNISASGARDNWFTHPHHASSAMNRAIRGFNEQLEKLAELFIVLVVGILLPSIAPFAAAWWFIPVLFLLVRPLAIVTGMAGEPFRRDQMIIIGWFGIRGIGSIFYLMYALAQGVTGPLAQDLVSLTLLTVATSIMVHGISAFPLMTWYVARKQRDGTP
ncbi:cation:proton antiporter [Paludibacterium purpuratum]|nr:cation:proton antiporter [Paludibacterium purpuratum]